MQLAFLLMKVANGFNHETYNTLEYYNTKVLLTTKYYIKFYVILHHFKYLRHLSVKEKAEI